MGKPAGFFGSGVRVFLHQIGGQKLREIGDASRVPRHSRRKHVGTRKAQVRERCIVAEEVDDFDLVRFAWVDRFDGR
jgi:hypothetical protein